MKSTSPLHYLSNKWTSFFEVFKLEIWALLSISTPIFLSFVCQFGMGVTDNVFLGHLGADELAAAALANTWMWATMSPAFGISFALDTLGSQAYGAKNYRLVGILLQNALFITSIICVPVVLIWMYTEPILILLKIEKDVAVMSATFVRYVTPSVFPTMYFGVLQRYLQSQNITTPALICNCLGFVLNIFLDWLFVFGIGWGFEGAAIATTVSKFLQPVLLWGYMYLRGLHKKTWFGWSSQMISITRLKIFLKFGTPSALMFWFEVLGFEISTFIAGELHDTDLLSAHSICRGYSMISFIVPLGLGIGTSIRVGNLLGEGFPSEAKNAAKVGFFFTTCCMVINCVVLVAFRTLLVRIYTTDQHVLGIAEDLMFFLAVCTFLDGTQTSFGSILRGAGHQIIGTVVNLIGFHLVATPLYIIFGLVLGWGLYGIWGGLASGLAVNTIGTGIAASRINWEKESLKAKERSADKANFETLHESDEDVLALKELDEEEEAGEMQQHSSYKILTQGEEEADENDSQS